MTRNVLWLGTSSDRGARLPGGKQVPTIITDRLSEAAGLELAPVVKVPWPTPDLLDLLDGWLDRYDPVVVVLHANSFWFTYESSPEKVRRLLGPVGGLLATAGLRAASVSALAENPVFKSARKMAVRTVGGDLLMPPKSALALFQDMIRAVVAREDVTMLVRGPMTAHNSAGTERGFAKSERRRAYVHSALGSFCDQLHVAYIGWDVSPTGFKNPELMTGDDVHVTPEYQAVQASEEAGALIAAWRETHGVQ